MIKNTNPVSHEKNDEMVDCETDKINHLISSLTINDKEGRDGGRLR